MKKSAQFIHIETYSDKKQARKKNKNGNEILDHDSDFRETTTTGVLGEALRVDGYCDHVDFPEEPIVLYGVDIKGVEALVADYRANFKLIDSNGKARALRKDACALLAGTISLKREDIDDWEDYKKASIEYLKNKYGHRLKSIIEHTDEEPLHIHFFVVADHNEVLNDLHEGKKAVSDIRKKNRKAKKEDKVDQKSAYTKAMVQFQDDFYFSVAKKFGFSRTGEKPKTRIPETRLYKQAEKERLAQIEMIEEKKKEVENLNKTLKEKEKLINKEKEKAKKEALEFVIDDFNNKNFLNKTITSITFNKEKNQNYDKIFNKNKNLNNQIMLMQDRKNYYKNKYNNTLSENKDLKNKTIINDFLNFDLNLKEEKEENKNDIRRTIITKITEFENELQQYNKSIQRFSEKQQKTRFGFAEVKGKFDRIRNVLYSNFKNFVGDLFSINNFERKFKENKFKNEEIKKIKRIENQNGFTRTSPRNDIKPKI